MQGHIYVYGGVAEGRVVNELWRLDTLRNTWSLINITVSANQTSGQGTGQQTMPLPGSGHTAHVVNRTMYVVFGYSPAYGYMNQVQTFQLGLYF